MGAAALAGRLALRHDRRAATASTAADDSLAFHQVGGPLVAVCGLTGGAGASTLAYLLARRAARHSSSPVLLAELVSGGGLSALTGRASPFGLAELAGAVADQHPVGQPFAELDDGLRLVAAAQRPESQLELAEPLAGLLSDARAAHGLVVVDTGPPGPQTKCALGVGQPRAVRAAGFSAGAAPGAVTGSRRVVFPHWRPTQRSGGHRPVAELGGFHQAVASAGRTARRPAAAGAAQP